MTALGEGLWPAGCTYRDILLTLLRPYGRLLGTWAGEVAPCGSLLVVVLDPPCIRGAYASCVSLNDGVRLLPAFEVRLEAVAPAGPALWPAGQGGSPGLQHSQPAGAPEPCAQGSSGAGGGGGDRGGQPMGAAFTVPSGQTTGRPLPGSNDRGRGCRPPAPPRFRAVARCLRADAGEERRRSRHSAAPAAVLQQQGDTGIGGRPHPAAAAPSGPDACWFHQPCLPHVSHATSALLSGAFSSGGSPSSPSLATARRLAVCEAAEQPPAARWLLPPMQRCRTSDSFVLKCGHGCPQDELEIYARQGLERVPNSHGGRTLRLPLAPQLCHTALATPGPMPVLPDVRPVPEKVRLEQVHQAMLQVMQHYRPLPEMQAEGDWEEEEEEEEEEEGWEEEVTVAPAQDFVDATPGELVSAGSSSEDEEEEAYAQRTAGSLGVTYRPLTLQRPEPHPLCGVWVGTYGTHGMEFITMAYESSAATSALGGPSSSARLESAGTADEGGTLTCTKVTGDYHVPAGQRTFHIFTSGSIPPHLHELLADSLQAQDMLLPDALEDDGGLRHMLGRPGELMRLPHGYASRVELQGHRLRIREAWPACAQVAQPGFLHPLWFRAACVVLDLEQDDDAQDQLPAADTAPAAAGALSPAAATSVPTTGVSGSTFAAAGTGAAGAPPASPAGRVLPAALSPRTPGTAGASSSSALEALASQAAASACTKTCIVGMAWTHVETFSLFVRVELPLAVSPS